MSRSSRKASFSPEAWARRLAHNREWCKAHRDQINARRKARGLPPRPKTDRQREQDRVRAQRNRDKAREEGMVLPRRKDEFTPEEWAEKMARNAAYKRSRRETLKAAGVVKAAKPEDAKLHKMEIEQARKDREAERERLKARRFYRPFQQGDHHV